MLKFLSLAASGSPLPSSVCPGVYLAMTGSVAKLGGSIADEELLLSYLLSFPIPMSSFSLFICYCGAVTKKFWILEGKVVADSWPSGVGIR